MKKATLIVTILIIALIVSIGVNAYQAITLSNQNKEQATKLEMSTILTQAQVQINAELKKLGDSIVQASEKLSTTELSGEQAREILAELAQNNSAIIDASTLDLTGKFITVEPATYSSIEGTTTTFSYDMFARSNDPIKPIMSGPYLLAEGVNGSVIMAPIFNSNGAIIGSVSLAFDQSALISATATEVCRGTPYVIWASDVEGTMIYEVNKAEEGTNLFTDPTISTWSSLQTFGRQMVSQTAGYGTYEYFNYENTGNTVVKQAYWATIGVYGAGWRLIITNVLP